MNFEGSVVIPVSAENYLKYHYNKTFKRRMLIASSVEAAVKHFSFSSTAATYGAPKVLPVSEASPKLPISPYGMAK